MSGAQCKVNCQAIDELQRGSYYHFRGQDIASSFLLAIRSVTITNNRGKKLVQEQIDQRINNIGGANIIIIKWVTIKDVDSDYESCIYPDTATT